MQDPFAGGHPLRAAVADEAAAALAVVVLQQPVDHVRNRLEPAVRVPRCALGFSGCVVDLAHLVHVDEGIEGGEVDAGEGAAQAEITGGLASILNATTPIWGVIVAHLFTADEKATLEDPGSWP